MLDLAFDPDFCYDGEAKTGLSMAISKFLIEAMQGALELQPSDNGTSYIVSIPVSL
jgi:signal transduction histidine kinase